MAQEFVENILEVHRKYRALIQDVFQGDQAFVGALDKACTAVINHRPPKQPAKAPELVTYLKKLSLKKQLVQMKVFKSKTEFFEVIKLK
jgi:cullin 2